MGLCIRMQSNPMISMCINKTDLCKHFQIPCLPLELVKESMVKVIFVRSTLFILGFF